MLTPSYELPRLPPNLDLETLQVMRALALAHRSLAELKGRAATIPNQGILIDSLSLQEAKASSEIENIVTTQDELFQGDLFPDGLQSASAKEVALYRDALKLGYRNLLQSDGLITNNTLIKMFQLLTGRDDGFRTMSGVALKNDRTGDIVYVPPQEAGQIITCMTDLERFINDDEACHLDALIKMAIIHHQFESIHPFPDGNGRIGRILNVLYLTRSGLLDIPVLYLSRHITRTKGEYYRLLQNVRETNGNADTWQERVLYILRAVAETATTTLGIIEGIREQMASFKHSFARYVAENLLPRFIEQFIPPSLYSY